MEQLLQRYFEALIETSRARAGEVVEEALAGGVSAETVLLELIVPAMAKLGVTVAVDPGTTLAQHFVASQIAAEMTDRLLPLFDGAPRGLGTVVLGTAAGDFHGLGKRIVGGCLRARLIEVVDLGLNVPADRYVAEAVQLGAQVIGVSSMMAHTARGKDGPSMVRQLLHEGGLEDRIKLAVGGAPYRFDPELYRTVGADAWAENGSAAASVIAELIAQVGGP